MWDTKSVEETKTYACGCEITMQGDKLCKPPDSCGHTECPKKDINKVIKKRKEMRTLRLLLMLIPFDYMSLINLSKRRDTVRSFSNLTIKVELVK